MENYKEIERSIITKYRKTIWSRFVKAVQDYELIKENDKIMVCISGGKDSFLLAKCIEELQRHGKFPFEAEFVVMNPGYNELNQKMIDENAKKLNLNIKVFKSDIFDIVTTVDKSPCYLCARMRRGYLYSKAQELGCNKIALGHHFDDAIETTLLNMFYCGEFKTMMPKLKSTNHPGMELIRPMIKISERDIITYMNYCEIKALGCACKVSEGVVDSQRKEMKEFIVELRKKYPIADKCIFKSAENVNLNCVMGYKKGDTKFSFLDDYDE